MIVDLPEKGLWLFNDSALLKTKPHVFYYKADNEDNKTFTNQRIKHRLCYHPDSNVLKYLSDLFEDKLINQYQVKELKKLIFLMSQGKNDVNSFLATWELASPKGTFPIGDINEAIAIKYLEVVLKAQCVDLQTISIGYQVTFDPFKVALMLKKYDSRNIADAASVYYKRLFKVLVVEWKKYIEERINLHKKYMEICHDVHMMSLKRNSPIKNKFQYFVEQIHKHGLPRVPKTFYLCVRILSNEVRKGNESIKPINRHNTAVDLFFSDFIHFSNRVNVDGIENRNIFVTCDRLSHLAEETETLIFQWPNQQLRGDYLDFSFIKNKEDSEAVSKF